MKVNNSVSTVVVDEGNVFNESPKITNNPKVH